MSAKQNSKGVRWGRAVAHVGIVGAYLALVAACSGSIEETDVDRTRSERASSTPAPPGNTDAPAAPSPTTSTANSSSTATQPATNQTATNPPPASPPPASPPPASPPPVDEEPPASGALSFEADVYPILSSACAPCHGAGGIAGISVADSDVEAALENAVAEEAGILGRIESGSMPQGCGGPPGSGGPCLTEDEFATLEAWYEAGAPE